MGWWLLLFTPNDSVAAPVVAKYPAIATISNSALTSDITSTNLTSSITRTGPGSITIGRRTS